MPPQKCNVVFLWNVFFDRNAYLSETIISIKTCNSFYIYQRLLWRIFTRNKSFYILQKREQRNTYYIAKTSRQYKLWSFWYPTTFLFFLLFVSYNHFVMSISTRITYLRMWMSTNVSIIFRFDTHVMFDQSWTNHCSL